MISVCVSEYSVLLDSPIFVQVTVGRGLPSVTQRSSMSFPSVKLYDVEFGVIEGASETFSEHIKALLDRGNDTARLIK